MLPTIPRKLTFDPLNPQLWSTYPGTWLCPSSLSQPPSLLKVGCRNPTVKNTSPPFPNTNSLQHQSEQAAGAVQLNATQSASTPSVVHPKDGVALPTTTVTLPKRSVSPVMESVGPLRLGPLELEGGAVPTRATQSVLPRCAVLQKVSLEKSVVGWIRVENYLRGCGDCGRAAKWVYVVYVQWADQGVS